MNKKYNIKLDKLITKKLLIKEYTHNKKPMHLIADKMKCSWGTIRRKLIKYKIKIRTASESFKCSSKEKYKISKKELYNLYWNNNKSIREIAKIFNCSYEVIRNRLKKYKIKIRSNSESRIGKYCGKNSFSFKDGRCSKQYYCKICGKKITFHCAIYKKGYCKKCGYKIRKSRKGKDNNMYIDNRCSKTYYCIEKGCNNVISYCNWKYGGKRCGSHARIKLWQNKKYRENLLSEENFKKRSCNFTQNKPEKLLEELLNKLLPKQYKFVGNGKIFIAGFVPDFININGKKYLIEMYGDFWHNRPDAIKRDKRRLKTYKKYGYKTLIIWEHELKDLNKVKEKVLEFNK